MSDWKEYKFSELCDISRGASPRPIHEYMTDGEGMPWVKIADATKSNSRFIEDTAERIKLSGVKKSVEVFEGDLILSNSATPGLPKFMAINACIHDGWMLLRNFKNITKEFAYWLLLNERNNLVKQGTGTVFINLKTDILKNHIVKIPSIEEQNKIVSILNRIEDKIHLNTQINQTLEQIAQALFKSWFVDFDPVRAKVQALSDGLSLEQAELAVMQAISGKTPEELTALSQTKPDRYAELAETAKAFPCEMVEIDGGEVPKGWEIKPIELILDRLKNKQKLRKEEISFEGTIPVFEQGTSIFMGYHDKDAAFNASIDEPIFIFGDHTCITKLSTIPFSIYQNVIPLIGKNLPTYWVYCAIQNKQTFQEYRRHWSELIVKEVVVPDNINLCQCFSKKIKELFFKIDINHQENRNLIETRDLLLPRLLNGEI
ncbi:restriction endonuclease subunit S [Haemophilus haemolyticus]|uniref:Predicted nucleotidyltransferases n=1 Tax=Haemophilus haemolyticus TaxID=726 RepID=A0A2X4R6M5_HAEHA|nr:restriction endonuclease subunit S [Haemophilus haemolyticus]SQH97461.1 Predicted nucleotidyltransferases [Haemophilus haemolyticus]